MITLGKWITKHKNIILLIAVILLVPSAIGYVTTRVNYDVLSYLPATLETVEGQDILVDEFGMGASFNGYSRRHGYERSSRFGETDRRD